MEEKEETESTDIFNEIYNFGLLIFSDDVHDLGKGPLHTPEEIAKGDFPIHHWVYGALLMGASVIGKVLFALDSARRASDILSSEPQL